MSKAVFDFFLDKAVSEYEEILEKDIPFPQKLKLAMERRHDAEAESARSYFSEYAWKDKALQQLYYDAAAEKSTRLYIKYIDLGKKEGAIDWDIPNDAILAYLFSIMDILQSHEDKTDNDTFRAGIFKLLLYGLLGKEA